MIGEVHGNCSNQLQALTETARCPYSKLDLYRVCPVSTRGWCRVNPVSKKCMVCSASKKGWCRVLNVGYFSVGC